MKLFKPSDFTPEKMAAAAQEGFAEGRQSTDTIPDAMARVCNQRLAEYLETCPLVYEKSDHSYTDGYVWGDGGEEPERREHSHTARLVDIRKIEEKE